jgi:hypothetical protein
MTTEPASTTQDSKSLVIHAVYLCVIVIAVLLTWFVTSTKASLSRMGLQHQVQCITYLMDQYSQMKAKTGEWPDATELYGDRFQLVSSVESDATRVDTFFSHPEMWLEFRLRGADEITFDVSWGESPRSPR